ncbi:MAG: hypothetical protein Q8N08_03405 [Methanobacteriaceae archaeon]|nr:hypothetical protein [Methanobacteriaceae archaeon]
MPVESIKIIKPGSLILDTFETPKSGLLALKYFQEWVVAPQ